MNTIQTILHATDFSDSAGNAFRLACSLSRDHAGRLVVLHVAPPQFPIVGDLLTSPPIPPDFPDEDQRVALLARMREKTIASAGVPITFRVEFGDPVDCILAVAAEENASLIVVGTHGRTGLKRLLMGSVAEHLVRKAPCSVLAVKSPTVERAPVATPDRELASQTV